MHTCALRLSRTVLLSLLAILCPAVALAAELLVSGRVVDSTGAPLPRAVIRITTPDGRALATLFSQADGTFSYRLDPARDCRVEAALLGFRAATAPCEAGTTLTLEVAPVQEAVVVTATRGEAPQSQVASSVTVFDEAQIERRLHPPVADLLRTAAGTTVVRVGGVGNVTSLFVRGGESSYNKVLLDGVPINEPGGTFNFSNVTSNHLERVELVRGAHSALFGSDAMASVVQLFTRRAHADGTSGTASFEGGSFDTARGSVGLAGRRGALDYSLGATRLTTDNQATNNAFRNTSLSATAGVALPARSSLRVVLRGELGRTGVPGATAFGRADRDAFFDRRDGVAGVTFSQAVTAALQHRVTYALAVSGQQSTNLVLDPPYTPSFEGRAAPFEFFDFPYDLHSDLRRHHAAYQADWRMASGGRGGTHLLTLAFDWDGERATIEDRPGQSVIEARRDNFGWTVQHQALWRRIFLTSGVRLEANDSFGRSAVPRVSAAYLLRESGGAVGATKVKAAAGLGIKEPTILQSFSTSPFFLGNPDLDPERSRSLEAGVEQRLFGDRAKVEVTWFHNRFRDIISTRTLTFNPFTAQYFNVGLTRARGAEIALDVVPVPSLRASAAYTFLDSRILESTSPFNPVFAQGQWLFQRPRHSGYAALSATIGRATLDLIGRFTGRRVESDFSALEPPLVSNGGYALWDLRASYLLGRRLEAIGAVDNLTSRAYMEPLGFPGLRRAIRAGVRVRF